MNLIKNIKVKRNHNLVNDTTLSKVSSENLTFKMKQEIVKAQGVKLRKDRGQYLWFCPEECWFGYFDTPKEAWHEAFAWYGLEPLTNPTLASWKRYRQEQESMELAAA